MAITFVNNITINNINTVEESVNNFDKIMAVYDLVGHYDNININANSYNSDISFDVIFKGFDEATKVFTILQRKEVSKYGHIFVPLLALNFNSINVQFIDRLN